MAIVNVCVQVNGKKQCCLELEENASQEDALNLALANERVIERVDGKALKKVIYKPGFVLNIIVEEYYA